MSDHANDRICETCVYCSFGGYCDERGKHLTSIEQPACEKYERHPLLEQIEQLKAALKAKDEHINELRELEAELVRAMEDVLRYSTDTVWVGEVETLVDRMVSIGVYSQDVYEGAKPWEVNA